MTLLVVIEGDPKISQVLIERNWEVSLAINRCKNVVPLRGLPMINTGSLILIPWYLGKNSSSRYKPAQIISWAGR
jgi:hypothetical protein